MVIYATVLEKFIKLFLILGKSFEVRNEILSYLGVHKLKLVEVQIGTRDGVGAHQDNALEHGVEDELLGLE